jgi:hypothetical protein
MFLGVDMTHAEHSERRKSACKRATSFARYFSLGKHRRVRVAIGEQGQVGGGGAQRPRMRAAIAQSRCCGAPHILVA